MAIRLAQSCNSQLQRIAHRASNVYKGKVGQTGRDHVMEKLRAAYDTVLALGVIAAGVACLASLWFGPASGMLAAMIAFAGLLLLEWGVVSLFIRRTRDDRVGDPDTHPEANDADGGGD